VLAAIAAAAGGFAAVQPWRWALVPACLVGVVLAEKFPVKIGPEQKVNLGALPCLVAALLLPPGVGPATVGLSVLAGNRIVGRSWAETALNSGNTLSAAALAALVGPVGQDVDATLALRASAAAFLYLVVNLCVAVLPAALHSGRPYLGVLRQAAQATWPALLTLGACGVSIAVLAVEAPVVAPLPLVVLPMIYRMNRAIEAQSRANAQIAGVLAAQRRFLTDVSHQVATPLATIMTNLAILHRAQRSGPAGEAIADSVAEAERMKRMLGRLRSLAHADEDVPLRRELVDLAELTADVVRAYTAQAATSGVGLVTEVGAHQPRRQRRPCEPARRAGEAASGPRFGWASDRGRRRRPWHRGGAPPQALRAVSAQRCRNRAGLGHREAGGGASRRDDPGQDRAGCGQYLYHRITGVGVFGSGPHEWGEDSFIYLTRPPS